MNPLQITVIFSLLKFRFQLENRSLFSVVVLFDSPHCSYWSCRITMMFSLLFKSMSCLTYCWKTWTEERIKWKMRAYFGKIDRVTWSNPHRVKKVCMKFAVDWFTCWQQWLLNSISSQVLPAWSLNILHELPPGTPSSTRSPKQVMLNGYNKLPVHVDESMYVCECCDELATCSECHNLA